MDDINLLRVKADYIIQADTGNAASIITELVEFSKSHVIKGILTLFGLSCGSDDAGH